MLRLDAYLKEEMISMAKLYNKAKERHIKEGDLFLMEIKTIKRGPIQGKVTPN